jgi:hypothetical protein
MLLSRMLQNASLSRTSEFTLSCRSEGSVQQARLELTLSRNDLDSPA